MLEFNKKESNLKKSDSTSTILTNPAVPLRISLRRTKTSVTLIKSMTEQQKLFTNCLTSKYRVEDTEGERKEKNTCIKT